MLSLLLIFITVVPSYGPKLDAPFSGVSPTCIKGWLDSICPILAWEHAFAERLYKESGQRETRETCTEL